MLAGGVSAQISDFRHHSLDVQQPSLVLQDMKAFLKPRAAGVSCHASTQSETTQLCSCVQENVKDLRPWRSRLHGWGLIANEDIAANSFVIEYVGEVVRNFVADLREREYDATGLGSCYMFRLDRDRVCDATRKVCRS